MEKRGGHDWVEESAVVKGGQGRLESLPRRGGVLYTTSQEHSGGLRLGWRPALRQDPGSQEGLLLLVGDAETPRKRKSENLRG